MDGIIRYLGYQRRDVFVGNVVRCRPFQGEPYNNKPTEKQKAICYKKWLWPELARVRPRVIVTLGRIAADAVHKDLWKEGGLTTNVGNGSRQVTVSMFSILHPAYWLRTRDPVFKEQVRELKRSIKIWDDILERTGI